MTQVLKKRLIQGERGSTIINQMLGNKFAMPATEVHTCYDCESECSHTVDYRLLDIDHALKVYKCTLCGCEWEYTEED